MFNLKPTEMRKSKLYYVTTVLLLSLTGLLTISCSGDDDEDSGGSSKAVPLSKMSNVSLNYRASSEVVTLSRDVESEGATVSLRKGVSWINNIRLAGRTIKFDVEENTGTTTGHRFDTLVIAEKGTTIGTVCVTQARNPFSDTRLVWANSNAMYRNTPLATSDYLSGLEMTKLIYNLEKTTGGKDSYRNYPAFAFCIEMNHDPENNMEWYLPSEDEMRTYANGESFSGTPLARHNYWWTSSENTWNGNAFNLYSGSIVTRGAVSKGEDWWVVAFRNGRIEE